MRPGTTIDILPDETMVAVGCRLARRLHRAPDTADERMLDNVVRGAVARLPELPAAIAQLGRPFTPATERAVLRAHQLLRRNVGGLVVCHGDLNPGNLLAAAREPWLAIDPLPVIAPPAYDAVSLVWSKRRWMLRQPDPIAVLERRIAVAADTLDTPPSEIRRWALVRLVGILVDRFGWGGYDETPFVTLAEQLADGFRD